MPFLMEQSMICGLETKVKGHFWLSMSSKIAEQKCHRGKVHRVMAFWVNEVGSASKFPWKGDTAQQLKISVSAGDGPYPELQTFVV